MKQVLKKRILGALAEILDVEGAFPNLKVSDVANKIGAPQKTVFTTMMNMSAMGIVMIDEMSDDPHFYINAQQLTKLRHGDPFNPNTRGTQINFNAPVHGSAIATDQASAIVNNRHQELLDRLAHELQSHQEIPEPTRRKWTESIREISQHPIALKIVEKLMGTIPIG